MLKSRTEFAPDDCEIAIQCLRLAKRALAEGPWKWDETLRNLASVIGIPAGRARKLINRDGIIHVSPEERRHIRRGMISALRWFSEYLRRRADYWDAVADEHELSERQM